MLVYSVLPAPQGHGIRTMAKLPLVPPPTLNTSVSELTAKETIVNILDLQNLPAAGATPAGRALAPGALGATFHGAPGALAAENNS